MSTNVRAVNAGQREWDTPAVPNVAPAPRKTSWWDSRIVNVIAAGLLIVAIGAGYWFSGIGPGGGGSGDDPRRFAAQALTPEASPESGLSTCNVEPLAEDEVIDMVREPALWIEQWSGTEGATVPSTVANSGWFLAYPDAGREPTGAEFQELQSAVNAYLGCLESGTLPQLWTFMDPHAVRISVQNNPTTAIPEDEIDLRVGQRMDNPAEWNFSGMSFGPDEYSFNAAEDPEHMRIDEIEGVMVAFVGTDTFSNSGALVQSTDWRDRRLIESGLESDSATLGAITLLRYPGIDQWLVYDVVLEEIEWTTPVAVMPTGQRPGQ